MTHFARIPAAAHPRPSSLRRLRKRYRRRTAEATATAPLLGGWGQSSEIRACDLLLVRQAIREGWDTPQHVRDAIVRDVVISSLNAQRPRLTLAAVRCAIDMVKDSRGGFDRHPSRRAAK